MHARPNARTSVDFHVKVPLTLCEIYVQYKQGSVSKSF